MSNTTQRYIIVEGNGPEWEKAIADTTLPHGEYCQYSDSPKPYPTDGRPLTRPVWPKETRDRRDLCECAVILETSEDMAAQICDALNGAA